MANIIHYDEDIFILNDMLKTLKRGCSINIDPFIFLEYTVNQLLFIHKALRELYSGINSSGSIKHPDRLSGILRLSGRFTDLLDDITGSVLPFSENMTAYFQEFLSIKQEHEASGTELRNILDSMDAGEEDEQVVSQEEFRFLFQPDEEE